MLGLWLEQGQLRLRDDLPMPRLPPGEIRIRLRLAGICATDIQLCRGYYPFTGILGHEFVGEIAALGRDHGTPWREGQRVVGEINLGCGDCAFCRQGLPNHCVQRQVVGIKDRPGAFAEYLSLPAKQLHAVPDNVPDAQAVFTEPLAAALAISEQIHLQPHHRVLVIGAGKLGQLIAQVLRLSSSDLAVTARHLAQYELLDTMDIRWVEHPEPRAWDVVVDATGSPSGLSRALECVKPRGVVVVKSTFGESVELPLARLVVDEIRLQGSRCGPFPPALRLLARKQVEPHRLISQSLPLSRGREALAMASTPGAGKILLHCNDSACVFPNKSHPVCRK